MVPVSNSTIWVGPLGRIGAGIHFFTTGYTFPGLKLLIQKIVTTATYFHRQLMFLTAKIYNNFSVLDGIIGNYLAYLNICRIATNTYICL